MFEAQESTARAYNVRDSLSKPSATSVLPLTLTSGKYYENKICSIVLSALTCR